MLRWMRGTPIEDKIRIYFIRIKSIIGMALKVDKMRRLGKVLRRKETGVVRLVKGFYVEKKKIRRWLIIGGLKWIKIMICVSKKNMGCGI